MSAPSAESPSSPPPPADSLGSLDCDLLAALPPRDRLAELALTLRDSFASAEPFPHVVIDDFLPADVARALSERFPSANEEQWTATDVKHELKLSEAREEWLPPLIRNQLFALRSAPFLRFVEELTGIGGLIPDPYLSGGGMHQIPDGGRVDIHIDFNRHDTFGLDGRLKLLVFLNPDWREEYGGHLELWSKEEKRRVQKILPVFNRCVIFATSHRAFHGHPDPLRCGPERTRKSLALYYFTNGRPAGEEPYDHGSEWLSESTENLSHRVRYMLKRTAQDLLPPVLYRRIARGSRRS